jgi:predicted NBD/HSP70 family sugar kinase
VAAGDTTPGTPRLLRSINDRAALELLLEHGPLTRTRLGALTGLSKPTASQMIDRLLTAGLVVAAGTASGGPGPSALLYAVNPAAAYAGGLDVTQVPGGTRVRAAIADLTGEVVGEFEVPEVIRAAAGVAERVRDALHGAAEAAGIAPSAVRHLVVGVPGAPHPRSGQLGFARDLPGWHGGILESLRDLLGIGVELENDVNLAAIAEQAHGQAKGADDFLVLWVGNGIGLAIVQDGRFLRGATGGAGEIGYMPVAMAPVAPAPAGKTTPASKDGPTAHNSFQSFAGRQAVVQLAREHGITTKDHGSAIRRAVETDNIPMLTELARRIARGAAPVLAVLDPALVVLSGTTLRAGGEVLKDLISRELRDVAIPRPRLVVSTVEGNPVLAGAIQASLRGVREDVYNRIS